jgi:hypothetical protein
MTSASTPATEAAVSSWLLPAADGARTRLEQAVIDAADRQAERAGPVRVLGAVARRALIEEIETKLRMVLSDTLADLVVGGWRAHAAIAKAVRKSRDEPGVDQVVPLRNHTITANRGHDLDVEVDGFQVLTLSAELVVKLQLFDAVAVVRDGHLVAVRSGTANAGGILTVEGVEVAKQTLTFPLTAELTMHRPRDLSS